MFDTLQQREAFHLAFLRALGRVLPPGSHALKGGSNLRFFFGSVRYSEDMDIDVHGVAVHVLREKVLAILGAGGFLDTLRIYGVERVLPPDSMKARETETVQRFKVHLITQANDDLLTKVEFSRRGLDSPVVAEAIPAAVLAPYHMAPLLASHYGPDAAIRQKLRSLVGRARPEPRDVFDLHVLSTRSGRSDESLGGCLAPEQVEAAKERLYRLEYGAFKDAVVGFLALEDRSTYASPAAWDQVRLDALALIDRAAAKSE